MSRRRDGWAPITFAAALLAGVLKFNGSAPDSTMHASSTRTPIHRQTGWLKGRVTRAITGLGLVGTIAVWGPQGWTDTQSVAARGVVLSSTAPATVQTRTRRPHLMVTKAGSDYREFWPKIDSSNLTTYATRYDVIYGDIPGDLIDRIRSINPNIILLEYSLPGGIQRKTRYPDSYYVRDAASGLKVSKNGWWLLNFRDPAVRNARLDDILRATPARVDGHWLDVSDANWLNSPFGNDWKDENGKMADLADLDGSWNPSLPRDAKPRYADGTWSPRMLDFIKELTAVAPGKLIIYNGLLGGAVLNANSAWPAYERDSRNNTHGAAKEGIFVTSHGYALSESDWKWWLDKAKGVIEQGKYVHFIPKVGNDWNLFKYAFASYLLLADGKYAWFDDEKPRRYDTSLFDVDYGAPLSGYQTIGTPDGPIYKRQFTNATVWVNPGSVTRNGDGKTLRPKSAIIEAEEPNQR